MAPRLAELQVHPDTCEALTESDTRAIAAWLRRLADEMERHERDGEGVFVLPGRRR